jgi:tetratricopeptide (TPR) repeat protein
MVGRRLLPSLLLFVFIFPACSNGPAPQTDAENAVEPSEDFVDWDQLDWKFWRHKLAHAYFFERLRVKDQFAKYREETWYDAVHERVSLEEFHSLPLDQQAMRRELAEEHFYRSRALRRIVDRGWEIWLMSYRKSVSDDAMVDEMGIITPAIKHLKLATGLDPTDPVAWYDLGYFAGIVGDRGMQGQSLTMGLAVLEEGSTPLWRQSEEMERLRLRLLLDLAWLQRHEGYYDKGLELTRQAIRQMADDDLRTGDEAREAMLLQALLMVDMGHIHEARQLARKLPDWRLHLQRHPSQYAGVTKPPLVKENMELIDSDFASDWVWIMTFHQLGEKDQVLSRMSERQYRVEFPAHLNHRYWQDMGRVLEDFGERSDSRLAYGFSIIYRPYYPYFPLQGARGLSRVTDQTGSGQAYFLGYKHFYVGGSYYSYAANRIVAMEMAPDDWAMRQVGQMAVDALGNCIRRGIRPASARALRARAYYRLGMQENALQDLEVAEAAFAELGEESAEVHKLMAIIRFEQDDNEGCLAAMHSYLSLEPEDGFGWRLSGLALANLERFDEAIAVMERALRLDPGAVESWYNLALVHLHLGEVDQARGLLDEAEGRFAGHEQVAHLQQLIRESPDQPIRMTAGPVALARPEGQSFWFAPAEAAGGLDLTAALDKGELENLLPDLWQRYSGEPDAATRLTLVRVLRQLERPAEVQDLLAPLWPDQLTRPEAMELLQADRLLREVKRARQAAEKLADGSDPYPDAEFWRLVAAVCLENGAEEEGRRALAAARELDPESADLD